MAPVLLTFALAALAPAEAPAPELPPLALDHYPAELAPRVAEALLRAQREPRSASATGDLGMLLHAHDQVAAAQACYQRARALDPSAFTWVYLDGVAQLRLGRQQGAVAALREAVRLQPDSVPARLKLGEALQAASDLEGSASSYTAVLATDPRSPQAQYGLGRVEAARGRAAEAAARFEEAIRLHEDFGAAQYALALAYRDLGREADARDRLALYQKYLLGAPPLSDPAMEQVRQRKGGASQHVAEGVRLGKANDLLGAVREHEKALQVDPTLAQAHANLISLFGRLRRWEKVDEHYQAAVALAPGLADVHYDYGVALTEQGKTKEAAEAFGKALAINPHHPGAHNNLGSLLLAEGRLDEAAGHFRAALKSDPRYRQAGFNLGRVLVARGDLRGAIAEFQRILTPEDADTPRYLYALAAAHVRAGDRATGLRLAREARQKAEALGQAQLVASIDKDLRGLEAPR
jgi:tetratricopeptide (TPR) repeat protein